MAERPTSPAARRRPPLGRGGAALALLVSFLAAAALTGALTYSAGRAEAPLRLVGDIPPGALAPALALLAERTGVRLVYLSSLATAQLTKGARAGRTVPEALAELLDGTGLEFEYLNARTVRIFRRAGGVPAEPPAGRARAAAPALAGGTGS